MPIVRMMATLPDRRDFGDGWPFARRFDGERCVAAADVVRERPH